MRVNLLAKIRVCVLSTSMKILLTAALALPVVAAALQFGWLTGSSIFKPATTLSGIGVSRSELSDAVLAARVKSMIESQTFAILRDPQALEGAKRITAPAMKKLFAEASRQSGLPASFIAAVAYLESWGNPKAQSPSGPKGIMQIAHGTAAAMGLKVRYARRYKTTTVTRKVRLKSGKTVTRKVRKRVPYTVLASDDRMIPSRAVPAAARYLARLEKHFGGRDWAVWAYHCGEGCTAQIRSVANRSDLPNPAGVENVFFGASPAKNRELYEAVQFHMERDYSPTYFFRITRAEQLLKLYEADPKTFIKMYEEYRNQVNPSQRAPHRLSVWLRPEDLSYQNCEDLKREQGRSLVRAFDDPKFFGFYLSPSIAREDPLNREYYLSASPAALGTIAYIAFETRRLHDAMKTHGEKFVPLEVTQLVMPRDAEERRAIKGELPSHCSGQVFDLNYAKLPPGQKEALDFVLNDLGWGGYLGFVRDAVESSTYHIGAAPQAREFFVRVYEEAVAKSRDTD